MHRFQSFFRHDTVRTKFNIIIVLIIGVLAFSLINFWMSMRIMSGIRAYVGGEGLWSKSQKGAVNSLLRYSESQNTADYNNFVRFLQVPLGDKRARLELNKPKPDMQIVTYGFVQGGNNPSDVNSMAFLYRRFHHVSYMNSAIAIWATADTEITRLLGLGEQLHAVNTAAGGQTDPQAAQSQTVKTAAILQQVHTIDSRLTVLENNFSATLGEGSRYIADILTKITVVSTIFIGILIVTIAVLIAKTIIRLDAAKTEFVSIASHQLRAPLTAINWYAEMLLTQKSSRLTTEQRQQLAELHQGGRRMARLINNILNVSSLDLGTYGHDSKVFAMPKVLGIVMKELQPIIDKKRLTVTANIDAAARNVNLDQASVVAILQNLISNSVKYTLPGGTIEIAIAVKRAHLLLRVSDTGVGIPRAQQAQVFTKFFIADNTKAMESDHTGLGLYIVKSMVDKLKGKIRFESLENTGTSFYITLPLQGGHHAHTYHT